MEKILQVQKRKMLSLASISSELGIEEGDYVSMEVVDGVLLVKPVAWHDRNQDYIWEKSVQEKLKQSHKDIDDGKYEKFDSLDQFADFIEKGIDHE